jgi:glycosyltransferase involved in cell wall biosynthesis
MNILILIPSLSGGGQEKAAAMLCNYLQQFHPVSVVCLQPLSGDEALFNCPVYPIAVPLKRNAIGKIQAMLRRRIHLMELKRKLRPDISIAFGETAVLLNAISAGGEKMIASIRQSLYKASLARPYYGFKYKRMLGQAFKRHHVTVAVCRELKEQVEKTFSTKDCRFIYNAIDPAAAEKNSKAELSAAAVDFFNRPVLAHLGRFDISKGQRHLVNIYCRLKKELPVAKLLMIGGTDERNPESEAIYEDCINELGRQGCKICFLNEHLTAGEARDADVMITGFVPNPAALLKRSTIFVFTSAWEGFPNAILEAMALGLPVISAACVTGPAELLKNGEDYGILMPPFDHFPSTSELVYKDWVIQLQSLLTNNSIAEKWRQQSLKRVNDFTADKILPQWLQLINELADQ